MSFTESDRTALDRAIAQGVLSVDYGDRRVTYRSLAEMREIRALMDSEIAAAAGTPRPRFFLGDSSKGV